MILDVNLPSQSKSSHKRLLKSPTLYIQAPISACELPTFTLQGLWNPTVVLFENDLYPMGGLPMGTALSITVSPCIDYSNCLVVIKMNTKSPVAPLSSCSIISRSTYIST